MRAAPWTLTRRITDYLFPHVVPGKHHEIWDTPRAEVLL